MVLSHSTSGRRPVSAPIRSATARTAPISTSVFIGLDGVSIRIRLSRPLPIASRAAASIAASLPPSAKPCGSMLMVRSVRASSVSVPP